MTMQEYDDRRLKLHNGHEYMIKSVKEHKTGIAESAKLILTSPHFSKLHNYVTKLRPLLCEDGHEETLLLPGGKPVTHVNNLLQFLGRKYNISVPTATRVRKIGATETARKVSGPTSTLVMNQLSHSVSTDQRYYQAIHGDDEAVEAFHMMENLRKESTAKQKQDQIPTVGPSSPSKPKRVKFTEEDVAAIKDYFKEELRLKVTHLWQDATH